MSIPEMEMNLIRIFPQRRFEKALLHRIKNRTLDESLGNNRHDLPKLANTAEDVIRIGGVFAIIPDPESCGINSIHVQGPTWRDYSRQYCCDGPKMMDGSHQYSQYNIKAIPITCIDGLGRSFIAGCTYNLTENSSCITEGAKKFFSSSFTNNELIIQEGSALMSDEAACFVKVAEDLGCQHALDRNHLNQQIVPAMENGRHA